MFNGVDPADTGTAYLRLDRALHETRAGDFRIPVSLAETASARVEAQCRLHHAEDLEWLDRWALAGLGDHPPDGNEAWQQSSALFLLRAALRNWQSGSPGEVWPMAFRGIRNEATRYLAVRGSAGPSRTLAEAMGRVIRRLNIRHMLEPGALDIQRWYRTITLQLGIRISSFPRLPFLLGTLNPEANCHENWVIHYLRAESDSFRKFRQVLVNLRRGNMTLSQAQSGLADSCWVWPGRLDELLAATLARPDIAVGDDEPFIPCLDDLLEQPWLDWNGGQPLFQTCLRSVSSNTAVLLGWSAETLLLAVDGVEVDSLLLEEDGSYSPMTNEPLTIERNQPAVPVIVSTRQGEILMASSLELFPEHSEFITFAAGRNPSRFRPIASPELGRKMLVMTPPEWEVKGRDVLSSRAIGWHFWYVPQDTDDLSIVDELGSVAWEGDSGAAGEQGNLLPSLAVLNPVNNHGHLRFLRLGEAFVPEVHNLPSGSTLVSAEWPTNRSGGLNPGGATVFTPERLRNGLRLTCRFSHSGRTKRVQVQPYSLNGLHLHGVVENAGGKWVAVDPFTPRNCSGLGTRVFDLAIGKKCPDNGPKERPPVVREGSRARGIIGNRGATLPPLDGLGEEVHAVSDNSGKALLFQSTYRGGIVDSVLFAEDEVSLFLSQPVPDLDQERHKLVTWHPETGMELIAAGFLESAGSGNRIVCSRKGLGNRACAGLAFDGVVLGWGAKAGIPALLDMFASALSQVGNPMAPRQLAAMAAAFPFPILRRKEITEWNGEVMLDGAAARLGSQFLLGWKCGAGPEFPLRTEPSSPAARRWMEVTANLLRQWRPEEEGPLARDAILESFFPEFQINDFAIWAKLACWNRHAFVFVLDSLKLVNNMGARREWAAGILGCLGPENDGGNNPHYLIQKWALHDGMVQISDILNAHIAGN